MVLVPRQSTRTDAEVLDETVDSEGCHRAAGLNIISPDEFQNPLRSVDRPDMERVSSGMESAYSKKHGKQASSVINGRRFFLLR